MFLQVREGIVGADKACLDGELAEVQIPADADAARDEPGGVFGVEGGEAGHD